MLISSQIYLFQTVPELGNYSSPFDRDGCDGGTRGGLPTSSVMQRDTKRMEGDEEDHYVTRGDMVSEKDPYLGSNLHITKQIRSSEFLIYAQ